MCAALFSLVLILSVTHSLNRNESRRAADASGIRDERLNIRIAIPPDEIFFPDEPDFLPGVLLEREQRAVWTEQDAAEHWQDPLRFGEEPWREMLEAAIQELLERIP